MGQHRTIVDNSINIVRTVIGTGGHFDDERSFGEHFDDERSFGGPRRNISKCLMIEAYS